MGTAGTGKTVNTSTEREIGFERGMITGYLDIAIDALVHLKERTSAGRAWMISDGQIEDVLAWLTAQREDVLRKERIDAKPPAVPLVPAGRFRPGPWTGGHGGHGGRENGSG